MCMNECVHKFTRTYFAIGMLINCQQKGYNIDFVHNKFFSTNAHFIYSNLKHLFFVQETKKNEKLIYNNKRKRKI